jgi:beta-lactamase class D
MGIDSFFRNVNHENIRGWFVGYGGKQEHRYYFATYIQGRNADGEKSQVNYIENP